jgi:transcriptional regulator with XRE-family HTH domain
MEGAITTIPQLVRQPDELKAARQVLGLSAEQLAQMVGVEGGGRTVRRWEAGEREIPGPVIVIMETAMSYLGQRAGITQKIEMIETGQLKSGSKSWLHPTGVDTTGEELERLRGHKRMFEEALEILTRGVVTGSEGGNQVHWYTLKRMTPKYSPPIKDDWSHPGEKSVQAALAYFAKQICPGQDLAVCPDDDMSADFILEKRLVVRSQHGAHQRLQPGELVETLYVRTA